MLKFISQSIKADKPLRFKRLATKEKFYLAQLTDGLQVRRLAKKFKRARDAEAYAKEIARRLPFWQRREVGNE